MSNKPDDEDWSDWDDAQAHLAMGVGQFVRKLEGWMQHIADALEEWVEKHKEEE